MFAGKGDGRGRKKGGREGDWDYSGGRDGLPATNSMGTSTSTSSYRIAKTSRVGEGRAGERERVALHPLIKAAMLFRAPLPMACIIHALLA